MHSDTTVIAQKGAKMVMKGALKRTRNEFLLSNSDTVNGNKNISIKGGIWDGNNTAPENEKPDLFDKSGYSGAVINFVNVNDLELSDMVLANSVTFYIRISKVHRFKIENIDLVRRDHEEDMNDCLLTYKLDPGNLKFLRSSPSLKCTFYLPFPH